jgi:hypothetical protein
VKNNSHLGKTIKSMNKNDKMPVSMGIFHSINHATFYIKNI